MKVKQVNNRILMHFVNSEGYRVYYCKVGNDTIYIKWQMLYDEFLNVRRFYPVEELIGYSMIDALYHISKSN